MTRSRTALARTAPSDILPWRETPDPVSRYLSRLSRGSVPAQASALKTIAKMLGVSDPRAVPWHAFTATAADALTRKLRDRFKPATVNRMLAAVRGVLDICRMERWLVTPRDDGHPISQRDHFDDLCSRLSAPAPRGKHHGHRISDAELDLLFKSCMKDGLQGLRDAATIALGIGAGLRREEIANLALDEVHLPEGRVEVLHGKGDKARTAFLPRSGVKVVQTWLSARGNKPGPLLVRLVRGKLTLRALSPHAVWESLQRRREMAGVEKFTPHDMRRTCTTRLLRAGVAIGDVQMMLGHESIETTRRYDLSDLDEMQAAVQAVDVNFGDKTELGEG